MAIRVAHVATVDLTHRFLLLPQLRRLRDEGYEVTAISAPGPWTGDLESEGIRHLAWPHATRSWDPRADVRAFAELTKLFRRERFDLVHTHNPKPGVLGRIGARVAGVPRVVNTVHGFYATPEDPPAKRHAVLAAERLAARFSDLELYQSAEDLAWAQRLHLVEPSRSRLLGNGIDLRRFDPQQVPPERLAELRLQFDLDPGDLVVGTVGRIVAEKGYREYFQAATDVRSAMPGVRFLAIGDVDPEKQDGLSREEIAEVAGEVQVTGWREDVRDLLALMDVFVLASWREGLPRSAIEAAAMGRPMVLTYIRGCREVVVDGAQGLLIPPRNARRLGDAIMGLLRDADARRRMGESARARALERFDENRVLETLVRSYELLLPRKRAGQGKLMGRPTRSADAMVIARPQSGSVPKRGVKT